MIQVSDKTEQQADSQTQCTTANRVRKVLSETLYEILPFQGDTVTMIETITTSK